MKKNNDKKPLDSEKKLELAKAIAEKSESFKKTYNAIENHLLKGFKAISSGVDYILFSKKLMKPVSVLIAILLYISINGTNTNGFIPSLKQSIVLEDVQVISNISDSVYEVEGLPESVDVIVRGDSSDVQFVSQQRESLQILADLEAFGEGSYEVTFQPVNFSDKVEVSIEPSTAVVSVKRKQARTFSVGYDYINTDKIDKIYSLGEPTFSQSEVIVNASEETLSKVAFVKALINLEGVKGDFVQDCVLVAYDQSGAQIDVDILPKTITAEVKVTTPSKVVPIDVQFEGETEDGISIDSYTLDASEMTIYGKQEILDEIDEVSVIVPVNKITSDTTITMPIMLPSGISSGSVSKVSISIKVGEQEEKVLRDVELEFKNVNSKFNVSIIGSATTDIEVFATESVLDSIDKNSVNVFVDVSQYDVAGTYTIPLSLEAQSSLARYVLTTKSVEIELKEK